MLLLSGVLSTFLVHHFCHGSKDGTIAGVGAIVAVFMSLAVFGERTGEGINVVLPLGLVYSLRLIHYLLESYKGNLRAHRFDVEYLC